jgi:hypothetical protein
MNFLNPAILTLVAGAAFLFSGCAAPRTVVQTDGQNGTILIKADPAYAMVDVDGTVMGKAREFDGTSAVLKVTPGKHLVTFRADGYEDFTTQVYISDTQEKIEINLRKKP